MNWFHILKNRGKKDSWMYIRSKEDMIFLDEVIQKQVTDKIQ